ncbi:MAG: hypothetical protein JNG88_05240, partial [Phycisphaerales bacterium]|nr:hypothetical protein [Phycisphaerales bacterium]
LKLMEDSFRSTDDQIRRITQGEMSVDEFRNPARFQKQRNREAANNPPPPPPPPTPVANPPAPTAPPPGDHPMEPIPDQPPQKIGDGSETHEDIARAEREKEAAMAAEAARQSEKVGEESQPAQPMEQPAEQPVGENQPQPTGDAAAAHEQIRKAVDKKDAQPGKVSKNFESEWETYVRSFIDKYKLTPEQAQKAQDILKDCEQQAERHLKSRESRLNDLDKREAALKTSKDKNVGKETTKINEDRQKLLAPIGDIFEKQLKPKLERLPTSKQRKEAEASKKGAASAPPAGKKPATNAKADPRKPTAAPPKPSDKLPAKGNATPTPANPPPQPDQPPADAPVEQHEESKGENAPPAEGGEEPK